MLQLAVIVQCSCLLLVFCHRAFILSVHVGVVQGLTRACSVTETCVSRVEVKAEMLSVTFLSLQFLKNMVKTKMNVGLGTRQLAGERA